MRGRFVVALLGFLGMHAAWAAELRDVELATAPQGAVQATLVFDAPARFRLYELEGPPRIVVIAPGASLRAGLGPQLGGVGFVQAVRLRQGQAGVRVEFALSRRANARTQPEGARLKLVLVPEGKSVAAKAAAKKAQAAQAVIKDITVRDLEGASELVIMGDHLRVNHNAFLTPDGRKLILDFWGAKLALAKQHYSFPAQFVASVDAGEAPGRVRLVVGLPSTAPASYQIEPGANRFVVRFGPRLGRRMAAALTVEEVQFQPEDRIARVSVRTDRPNPVINVQRKKNMVIVDVAKARLAPGQERTLDVSAFPGPVKQVDVYQLGDRVRIVARLRERAQVTAFQSGNAATISFVPEGLALARRGETGARPSPYRGQKVSFNFKDIDIRNALALIAEMSGLNIIMSDDVKGTLTMRLENVPWDQALDLILAAKGLGKEQIGNVVRIAPLEVIRADAEAKRKAQESAEEAEPLYTEFIQLSYASVNDVKKILEGGSLQQGGQKSGEAGAAKKKKGLKLLSKRGSILLDERSNALIITDTRERLDNIKRIIKWLDRPMQQVLIEARIVEASEDFSRDLGVQWSGTYNDATRQFTHQLTGALGGGVVVDVPAQGPVFGLGYRLGTLSGVLNLGLTLTAAESEGKAKVLSNPRILTSNLQEAIIEQDIQIPYATTTFSGGVPTVSTQLQSAKLTLKVKPQITAERSIIMDLEIHRDQPRANTLVPNGQPILEKKQLKTKLLVQNGETVVLGGIYTQQTTNAVTGVPILSKIPLLGALFRRHLKSNKRNELLVFITPTIVEGGVRKTAARD